MKVFNESFLERLNEVDDCLLRSLSLLALDDRLLLISCVKLAEEVGELSEAVLARSDFQFRSKPDAQTENALAGEIADVIIMTLVIARRTGVDVEHALLKKIEQISSKLG
ncbi:MAG: hypothetical protein KC736_03110 [Candidatus Moranbacteria bacterium]|nr:hypothetical protein [Candidatus Moranbacteria bacterium]